MSGQRYGEGGEEEKEVDSSSKNKNPTLWMWGITGSGQIPNEMAGKIRLHMIRAGLSI